jgi:hypothetical protein
VYFIIIKQFIMNPLIIPLLRIMPSLVTGSTAIMALQQTAALGNSIVQANNRSLASKVGIALAQTIGLTPVRMIGGALQGAFSPVMRFLPHAHHGSNLEKGLLIKILKKPGEAYTVITGPDFASVVLINAGYVVIAVVIYIIVKNVVKGVIKYTYEYIYYKNNHKGDVEGAEKLYLH